jgi:Uma2 family endonuclease
MTVRPRLAPQDQLTIEEFLAFTAERPRGERWELIEGVAVLNPSPVHMHQVIVGNIVRFLLNEKDRLEAAWLASPGIGTRVPASGNSLPQPDVFVSESDASWEPQTADALVIFEVLSPSNRKADRTWRRKVYASVPNCQHYVTVSLKQDEVQVFDRATGWTERNLTGRTATPDLAALGVSLPLEAIYRFSPIGADA